VTLLASEFASGVVSMHSDLMPTDIIGTPILTLAREIFVFRSRRAAFKPTLLLVAEIIARARLRNARLALTLEAMQEPPPPSRRDFLGEWVHLSLATQI